MIKSLLTFLLIALSSLACRGQLPDSVKINNEWRYVYPVQEGVEYSNKFYNKFGLKWEELPVWIEWKLANDPRADLQSKKLRKAIYAELFKRLEVRDSIPEKNDLKAPDYTEGIFEWKDPNNKPVDYNHLSVILDNVPPVTQNLPSGKYVLYYSPYLILEKGGKQKIIQNQLAGLFEMKDGELNKRFLRMDLFGDTLTDGIYDSGLKTGNWFEFQVKDYSSNKKFFDITNYEFGLEHGEKKEYYGEDLTAVRNYKNGVLTGEVLELTPTDSIVYDAVQFKDFLIDYSQFFFRLNTPSLASLIKKNLLKLEEVEGIIPELSYFGEKLIPYKTLPDSINRKQEKTVFRKFSWNELPKFQTYFKKFDRKSKRLVYACYLDTVTRKFSGASWYPSGQLFDTVWTSKDSIVERVVYDLEGKVIYNSTDIKKTPLQFIDGISVEKKYRDSKHFYGYSSLGKTERNDTIYSSISWDMNKKRLGAGFRLKGDSIWQSIQYSGNGYYLKQTTTSGRTLICQEGKLRVHIFPVDSGTKKLDIFLDDKPYEGSISFTYKMKRNSEKWTLQLAGETVFEGERNKKLRTYSGLDGDFMTQFCRQLLGFYDKELQLKFFRGNIRNNQLEGIVKIQGEGNKNLELNYKNGLPNGAVALTSRSSKKEQKQIKDYIETFSSWRFSNNKFKRKYIYESYTFKDGLLDGLYVTYLSNGDTLKVIPFSQGKIEGKLKKIDTYDFLYATFHQDSLVGELTRLIQLPFSAVYDTVFYAKFDENGTFLKGFEIDQYDEEIHKITYERKDNGYVHYEIKDSTGIIERGVLDRFDYVYEEEYSNNLLKSSIHHIDSMKPVSSSDFLSFVYGYNLHDLVIEAPIETQYVSKRPQYWRNQINRIPDLYDHYFKKYFPNGMVSREGKFVSIGKDSHVIGHNKSGLWKVNDYEGHKQYELRYVDSLIKLGDKQWEIVGLQTDFDTLGNEISKRYVLFENETYQCSSDDYYTERQFITISGSDPNKMNGLTKNYYDNGALMNEGEMKNGLPEGLWKFYTPDGKLKGLGRYVEGKQNGKWLTGDLDEKAYIGGVCIDPDDPYYEFNVHSLENDKGIEVTIYKDGEALTRINYGKDKNSEGEEIRSDIRLR